jgi:hypothetical protein
MGAPGTAARSLSELVALLAPTIGQDKSRDAVVAAARHLGLEGDALAREEALSILDHLATSAGILGVAARFVRERSASRPARVVCEPPPAGDPAPAGVPSAGGAAAAKLKAQLAPALGQEKSEQLVADAMKQLGIDGHELTAAEASAILDLLAGTPGLVGVTARFARARLPRPAAE